MAAGQVGVGVVSLTTRTGYIWHHRQEMDSAQWQLPDGQYKVWVAILLSANLHADEWFSRRLKKDIIVPRGGFVTTQRGLADAARVGRQVVRGALANLSLMGAITTQDVTQGFTLISVMNYDAYQAEEPKANPQANPRPTHGQPTGNPGSRSRDSDTPKRGEENPVAGAPVSASFETFWKTYPKKVAKKDAARAWGKLNPDAALQATMLTALEAQKRSEAWTKDKGTFIPYPATWLNGARWTDELASPGKKDITAGGQPVGFLT